MNKNFIYAGIAFIVALILVVATPFFPLDEIAASVIGLFFLIKEAMDK